MRKGHRRRRVLAVVGSVLVLVLVVVVVRVERPVRGRGEVLFTDDFDGAAGQAPDPGRWGEWSGCTYNDSAYYGDVKCGARSTLDGDGHLVVPAAPGAGTSISTGGRFSFVYGEASAWVKMPKQVGYWPAFWMLNSDPGGKVGRPNGEIDVLEHYTTFPDSYHRGIHNWNEGDLAWSGTEDPLCGGTDLGSAFHKYTAKVEPGLVTFYFDDVQCGRAVTKEEGGGKPYLFGPDNLAGNWLLLTLAVGGADGQQKPATQPASMLVDRVEVRKL